MKQLYINLKDQGTRLILIIFLLGTHTLTAQNIEYEWAKNFGGSAYDYGNSICTDASGNVYFTGNFNGTADFDPGSGTNNLVSNGNSDIYITKLDAAGNLIWAKSVGGIADDIAYGITIDDFGNVYTTGSFSLTVDFDPGPGVNNLSYNGSADIFILKLDGSGNFVWAKNLGGASDEIGQSIVVDGSGNVYSTGWFYNTADFDPGTGVYNLTANGSMDIYISKLDASGNFVWAKNIGGTGADEGPSIRLDATGNILITGYFNNTVDFNPGTGTENITAVGSSDIFVLKLDVLGDFVWAKSFGGTSSNKGTSIDFDANGNVYTTGYFQGTVDFDPGTGTSNITSVGNNDSFISKLDASGNLIWVKRIGGNIGNEKGTAIRVDEFENVYTTGIYDGFVDFDPGAGSYMLSSFIGSQDIYISKLDASGDFVWAKSLGSAGYDLSTSIDVDAMGSVYLTGNFVANMDFDPGTGTSTLSTNGNSDVFILKLSCIPTSDTLIITTCDSYVFNGITYTTNNNTAKDTLVNAAGCDSILTLDLTINNSSNTTDIHIACDSLIWIDGLTYTSSNTTATDTLINAAGCDSIVTLDLTITAVDVTTTLAANTISANATGATYQWIDCSNGNIVIPAETNQFFTATISGDYAVVVTTGNCFDTSACVTITSVGINDLRQANNVFKLFPNPTATQVTISNFDSSIDHLTIIDITGKVMQSFAPTSAVIDVSFLHNGLYFVKIQKGAEVFTQKIVKQ